jgi:hypothetical protein
MNSVGRTGVLAPLPRVACRTPPFVSVLAGADPYSVTGGTSSAPLFATSVAVR